MRRGMDGSIAMSTVNGVRPRLLLVEDDPTSLRFMRAVLQALPASVDTAGSVAEAIAMATDGRHHLLLLDANLPDGSGSELLRLLRSNEPDASHVPAIAHTADDSPALHAQLAEDGFVAVLLKPLAADQLVQVVRHWLGTHAEPAAGRISEPPPILPLWDRAAALAAVNGSDADMTALRGIFLAELPRQHEAIMAALDGGDIAEARHHLHRLKASSGFVGASRLHAAAVALEGDLSDPARAQAFESVLLETRSLG